MAQNSQDWRIILQTAIPLLGIAGGFTAFLFNQRIKAKDEKIQDLKDKEKNLTAKLENAEGVKRELRATIVSFVDDQEKFLSPEALKVLNSILRELQIDKIQQREFEDCKNAAGWLQYQKKELIKSAAKNTIRFHRHLIPRSKRQRFKGDIEDCLKWVYVCLDFYGHPNVPLKQYINAPVINSSSPYIHAIRYIQSFEDIKSLDRRRSLTQQQSIYLKGMLDQLIERIPDTLN